ncbi:pentapeptide repeat-containing protein [Streptomyces anulatus]|uniref:pentapeptide repeat-containing protein n=1 Tax=Streptomyces anulatus TaxID=1892 RepID=UPI003255F34F
MPNPISPPPWPHCTHGATPQDPAGCPGIHVPGHTACLAHLATSDRDTYLTGLAPGDDIDHRGTPFTEPLLTDLLNALRDPATNEPQLGQADFEDATFTGDADFGGATFAGKADFGSVAFAGDAGFMGAVFAGDAWFVDAAFDGYVGFEGAAFDGDAQFGSAAFADYADFGGAAFDGDAGFGDVTFTGDADFGGAAFTGDARFMGAAFTGDADFMSAAFTGDADFMSAAFAGDADFGGAAFAGDADFGGAAFAGDAGFGEAAFTGDAWFGVVTFTGDADFGDVTFAGDAEFMGAAFAGDARFGDVTFAGDARFGEAAFTGDANFDDATFTGDAGFGSAAFTGDAGFGGVAFLADCSFEGASFGADARFQRAVFERTSKFGPLVCAGQVQLSGAEFGGPVALEIAARRVECRRTRWLATAELRLRYATVDFSQAVFEYPLTIAAEFNPFVLVDGQPPVPEGILGGAPDTTVRMASLRGVDAAHLVLADVDLSGCLFAGTVHLDQLRLEGACVFAKVPSRTAWRRWRPVRFTERRTLAEEHHWRACRRAAIPGWNMVGSSTGRVGPAQLAPVYRALRKSFEDSKNEPGAADFYYGEMEMRRHDREGTTRTERGLLHGYWALSGYGLRASRALYWLAATMLATVVLLMGFGIARDSPKQEATGTVPAGGGKVTFEIGKADPQNPKGDRFTGERFEKALNVTLDSVVFRSSGQDLTTAGTYIEMTSRLTEPVLLGLTVLAVRNRVKR